MFADLERQEVMAEWEAVMARSPKARKYPLQICWLGYSLSAPVIAIVIAALAEELLASVWLAVISLSGMLLSIGEVSDTTNAGKPASITTKAIKGISLFIGTVWLDHHRLPVK